MSSTPDVTQNRDRLERLRCVRRAMFDEPLLAHPAETGGVYATWHPHSPDDADRDQHDDDADNEQHLVLAGNHVFSRRIAILACLQTTVCALVHTASSP